jgi:hypothetical protein
MQNKIDNPGHVLLIYIYMLQYYQRPFFYFNRQIAGQIVSGTSHLRKSFWRLIPEGRYGYLDGRPLFESYLRSLEDRISGTIKLYSTAYWLHLSRRILPNSAGEDKSLITIAANRLILDAAIQKYAPTEFCIHVGKSKEVDVSEIFSGLLMADEFEEERQIVELSPNMIVLTDFTHLNLLEYYNLEKLCYEVWFCGAKLRGLQKGTIIEVDMSSEDIISEFRSEELEKLIASYDERKDDFYSSATGTVFTSDQFDSSSDVFIPILNVNHLPIEKLNVVFETLIGITFSEEYIPNFLLFPISLKKYIVAHLPFEKDFHSKYGVDFRCVLLALAALCYRYFYLLITKESLAIVSVMQRGYEGPVEVDDVLSIVLDFYPSAEALLESKIQYSKEEFKKAITFLSHPKRGEINLIYAGNVRMMVPAGENRLYLDYSLIAEILNNLFYGIDLNPYNFRGYTLESAIQSGKSFLPTKPCKNFKGEMKQVDFSVVVGKLLIIGECKVVAMSIGFYTGDHNAFAYRTRKVVERGISEVDDKARWLADNPIGRNYNLTGIDFILPLVISPFKEFIPSLQSQYWITRNLPRVLTISELRNFLDSRMELDELENKIQIPKSGNQV